MVRVTEAAQPIARRILLASYWYPPAIGAAAERIQAFSRYLPEHGWETHVVTAQHSGSRKDSGPARMHRVTGGWTAPVGPFADYDPRRGPKRVRNWLRDFVFPDRFVGWERRAVPVGLGLLERQRFHVILASFPPASAALLGLELHRRTGVPLVLDLRDRWFGPGGYEPRRGTARRKHERLEREVVEVAAGIVAVSNAMADAVAAEHGIPRDRVCVIPNGYEPGDVVATPTPAPTAASRGPTTIVHVGTVIARNRPDLFLRSVGDLARAGRLDDVRFRFVGNLSQAYLISAGLDAVIETTGLLPRERARAEMAAADALLLLVGDYVGRWGHNAKLFEYLRTGRPVLCLEETPGSNDRRLLEELAGKRAFFGRVDDTDDVAEALTRLGECCRSPTDTGPSRSHELARFSRSTQAGELAEFLAALV